MHLHLGIDGEDIRPDLACHYIVVNDWELGVNAPQNVVLVSIPSVLDPSLAPAGKHTIHVYTPGNEPYDLWQGLDRRSSEIRRTKAAAVPGHVECPGTHYARHPPTSGGEFDWNSVNPRAFPTKKQRHLWPCHFGSGGTFSWPSNTPSRVALHRRFHLPRHWLTGSSRQRHDYGQYSGIGKPTSAHVEAGPAINADPIRAEVVAMIAPKIPPGFIVPVAWASTRPGYRGNGVRQVDPVLAHPTLCGRLQKSQADKKCRCH